MSIKQNFDTSPFVRSALSRSGLTPPARVLDVPCGFGRHSSMLARLGFEVVAFDIDERRVETTAELSAEPGTIAAFKGDAQTGLPFEKASFDLVLIVHYVSTRILRDARDLLRPGGFLIFETFGAQSGNWIDLPKTDATRRELEPDFELLTYVENLVGPSKDAATVKLLAMKR